MSNYLEIQRAHHLGEQHGRNAAEWLWDGNTDNIEEYLCNLVRGIEEGDPRVLLDLPFADLSGQWAESMTPRDLAGYVEADPEDDGLMLEVCDAYEMGFDEGRDRRIYEAYLHYEAGGN